MLTGAELGARTVVRPSEDAMISTMITTVTISRRRTERRGPTPVAVVNTCV
jgi:hypothetical protein